LIFFDEPHIIYDKALKDKRDVTKKNN